MGSVVIKAGHVQPVWAGHPWVFAQAIERVEGGAQAGDEIQVRDARGNVLGRGLYSPRSAIPVRLFTRDDQTPIDGALFAARIERAIARRRELGLPSNETNALRLVHAEGDDLPGLVVDQLGDVIAVQLGTIGLKLREGMILDLLTRFLKPRAIVDRTPLTHAKTEGFEPTHGVIRGDTELDAFEFRERGLKFKIPFSLGHKTGFYVDQRPLRARIEELARGRRVLDTYSFVGAVALSAARGGAREVHAVDASAPVLEVAAECAALNELSGRVLFERADATELLNQAGRKGGYELVICDPPKLAPSRAAKTRALQSMRKLAQGGCRATKPGGLLVICSCSAAIGLNELTRAVALGARDVGAHALVLERFFQGPDHPVPAAFPEGLYLCSLIVEVVGSTAPAPLK
ncbi:MAG TPA: class I SAM-dependent rRNA methyltransferase [Polyangiaceae bacterium]|jgi:23S rRNA (cytosine1962-C5)-methyltransferase|nr:class I SAM-dependent rRNA methyltransferase [Polyangiaceae bacterium]